MDFTEFLTEASSYEQDLQKTLRKLPASHRKLVAGYKFKFQPGNGLKRDPNHIGVIDPDRKTITIAAPWNYGREYAVLHEVGHLVWETLSSVGKNKWKQVLRAHPTKDTPKQSEEEYFCMAFADTYANNEIKKFSIPAWHKFVISLDNSHTKTSGEK